MSQHGTQGGPVQPAWSFCVAGPPLKEAFHFTVLPAGAEVTGGCPLPAEVRSVLRGAVSVSVGGPSRVGAARLLAALSERLKGRGPLAFMAHRPPASPGAHLRKGYLLPCDEHVDTLIKEMGALSPTGEWHACHYEELEDGSVRQTVQRGGGRGPTGGVVAPAEAPPLHPAFLSSDTYPVFHCYEDARAVMEECVEFLPEAAEVLKLSEKWRKLDISASSPSPYPIVVLEGLDATGKSTVTRGLQRSLGAFLLPAPCFPLHSYGQLFAKQPDLIRRAFFCLRNYSLAGHASLAAQTGPVVLDRFWHSTAAYAVATENGGGSPAGECCGWAMGALPPEGHPVYRWPRDLPVPTVVVVLTLSPAERQRRLVDRGEDITEEEARLQEDAAFRERVEEAFLRMREPRCIPVDASGSKAAVLQRVLDVVRLEHCEDPEDPAEQRGC